MFFQRFGNAAFKTGASARSNDAKPTDMLLAGAPLYHIAGMIMGNTMTGVTLALKSFSDSLKSQRAKIDSLLNLGATPQKILLPYVNNALETALLPTLNSMVGMGIVSLPRMMTGQILSGTLPMTAIMYQIAIMIVICTTVCLSSFSSLHFGYQTLINSRNQIKLIGEE